MNARVETVPERKVLALRHIGPYPEIGEKFGQLAQWAEQHNVPVKVSLGWWHDDPDQVPASDLRSDACIVVPPDFQLGETKGLNLREDTIPGGEYAVWTHMGSYEGLGQAWGKLYSEVLPSLGRTPSSTAEFEIYVNDCSKVPTEEVRTDLYVSLEPLSEAP